MGENPLVAGVSLRIPMGSLQQSAPHNPVAENSRCSVDDITLHASCIYMHACQEFLVRRPTAAAARRSWNGDISGKPRYVSIPKLYGVSSL